LPYKKELDRAKTHTELLQKIGNYLRVVRRVGFFAEAFLVVRARVVFLAEVFLDFTAFLVVFLLTVEELFLLGTGVVRALVLLIFFRAEVFLVAFFLFTFFLAVVVFFEEVFFFAVVLGFDFTAFFLATFFLAVVFFFEVDEVFFLVVARGFDLTAFLAVFFLATVFFLARAAGLRVVLAREVEEVFLAGIC
jgi:hypothetical protein